ncbi:hypothetical protein NL108_002239 [Boleophthalmus pectinirostris]|nr:hypothetical protein NL108_002239 [Boleophthalmus pectinirostris]
MDGASVRRVIAQLLSLSSAFLLVPLLTGGAGVSDRASAQDRRWNRTKDAPTELMSILLFHYYGKEYQCFFNHRSRIYARGKPLCVTRGITSEHCFQDRCHYTQVQKWLLWHQGL